VHGSGLLQHMPLPPPFVVVLRDLRAKNAERVYLATRGSALLEARSWSDQDLSDALRDHARRGRNHGQASAAG